MACRGRPHRSSAAFLMLFAPALIGACARVEPASSQTPPPQPGGLPSGIEKLRGLPGGELARLLGEPDFVRDEPPAVIWQYRGTDCVLDLFLYRNGDALRVADVETHDRGPIRVSQSDCYADVVASRAQPR
jgi:hypothetical protein